MMKYTYIFALLFIIACQKQGIDPITQMPAKEDTKNPVINIAYPTEGTVITDLSKTVSVTYQLQVADDVEIASVVLTLDGKEIGNYKDFLDYRYFKLNDLTKDGLGNGKHTFKVVATDKSGKKTESIINFEKGVYKVLYEGEKFYMPFDASYREIISNTEATKVGEPTVEDGIIGKAYKGVADSYIAFPTTDFVSSTSFSATFWYKVNATPDRGGILIAGPEDPNMAGYPDVQNNRTSGFRLFREASGDKQRLKLNLGDGADIDPATGDWVHLAISISENKAGIYLDGVLAVETELTTPMSWEGCDIFSIGSGAPRFTEWGHKSDESLIDNLRLYNKALTAQEISTIKSTRK